MFIHSLAAPLIRWIRVTDLRPPNKTKIGTGNNTDGLVPPCEPHVDLEEDPVEHQEEHVPNPKVEHLKESFANLQRNLQESLDKQREELQC
uniref:Uncharacterized protein n=1 Tax=Cannabis sativa TaxID=3483 RepID=A0A803PD13_CANSA